MTMIAPEQKERVPTIWDVLSELSEAVTVLRSARETRDAARETAISALDYIRAMRTDTDPSVISGLEKIVSLLREGGAR